MIALENENKIFHERFKNRACGMSPKEVIGFFSVVLVSVASVVFGSINHKCPPLQPCDASQAHEYKPTCASDPVTKRLFLSVVKNASSSMGKEDYMELVTEHKWLSLVDTAGVSHDSMFSAISNDNSRLFYSEFAYHLNCGSNFAQQIIDKIDTAQPE